MEQRPESPQVSDEEKCDKEKSRAAVSEMLSATGETLRAAGEKLRATFAGGTPTRLSMTLDQKAAERLDRLAKDDLGKAEVIAHALAFEELLRQIAMQGGRLLFERPDGSVVEVLPAPAGPRELTIPDRELGLRDTDFRLVTGDALAEVLDAAPIDDEPLDENEREALAEVVAPEDLITLDEYRARRVS